MTNTGKIIRFSLIDNQTQCSVIAQGIKDICIAKKDVCSPNVSNEDEQNLIIVKEDSSHVAPITNPNELLQPIEAKFFSTSTLQRHSDVKFQAIVAGDQHVR